METDDAFDLYTTPSIDSSPGETLVDPETGEAYQMNPNRRIIAGEEQASPDGIGEVSSLVGAAGITSDWSGTVLVQVVECNSGTPTSGSKSIGCSVDSDYVLVGGGAQVVYSGAGALLWESRPADFDDSGAGLTWRASSKDHSGGDAHRLHAWAVGLKLMKTTGQWMSRNELKQYIKYRVTTSSQTAHPSGSCTVPPGYQVIGGGARANWSGAGQLLTASYPSSSSTWYASSKDHGTSDRATLNVYCIGIPTTSIPYYGDLVIDRLNTSNWVSTGVGTASGNVSTLRDREWPSRSSRAREMDPGGSTGSRQCDLPSEWTQRDWFGRSGIC